MREFKIAEPRTADEVAALLAETPETAALMAGGTDLLDELKSGVVEADLVVDLRGVAGLAGLTPEKGGLRIGAMTRIVELAEDEAIARDYPSLKQAALSLASPQLRNVGTVGGNLCQRPRCWYYRDPDVVCRKKGGCKCFAYQGRNKYHAIFGGGLCYIVYPSDLAPALISLGAKASIGTAKGDRTIPLEAFYALPDVDVTRENVLAKGEFLKSVWVPAPDGRAEGRLRQAQGARHLGLRPRLGGGHGGRQGGALAEPLDRHGRRRSGPVAVEESRGRPARQAGDGGPYPAGRRPRARGRRAAPGERSTRPTSSSPRSSGRSWPSCAAGSVIGPSASA